jgi:hypothetical protein
LKTAKWEIVFYGHLDNVFSNIKKWEFVKKWQAIWTVGISWVPDKKYKDYHLDFSLRKNPYNRDRAWKYSIYDYMKWDWEFKWKAKEFVLKNQYNIFKF